MVRQWGESLLSFHVLLAWYDLIFFFFNLQAISFHCADSGTDKNICKPFQGLAITLKWICKKWLIMCFMMQKCDIQLLFILLESIFYHAYDLLYTKMTIHIQICILRSYLILLKLVHLPHSHFIRYTLISNLWCLVGGNN